MASVSIQQPAGHSTSFEPIATRSSDISAKPNTIRPHDVHTTLNYYKDPGDGSPPAPTYVGKSETYERPTEVFNVTVHDIRGREQDYTLDKNGFQIHHHQSVERDFLDDAQIKASYYPETEQLLKDATGASRIFIFDHTIRRATKDIRNGPSTTTPSTAPAPINLRGPVQRVHIDQSYTAARSRVPHHLPEISERLLTTRHQIINVWRPIKKILRDPLAVADAHSVPESDLIPVGLIYPDRNGETLTVKPNEKHQWYYLYGQETDEVMLIKCYDSKLDGRARRVPHTAFVNPDTIGEAGRESIEVRALVFHEDEAAE